MEDYAMMSLLTTFGGIILYIVISIFVQAPGLGLSQRFSKLGNLAGKTYLEIKKTVGQEDSKSFITDKDGNLVTVRQWLQSGYHIVLLFDKNDICLGISSETSV